MLDLFSPFLIAIGQTAAVLTWLLYGDPDAFRSRRARIGFTAGFFLLLCLTQAMLHRYVSLGGMGSLPTLPFLAISWILYALFLFLWTGAGWEICCFLAFVLLLVDNCIWPLVSSISRLLWGVNYLYEGPLLLRLPFILALSLLECALAWAVRRQMPEIRIIRLSVYDAILAAAIVLPFLYIRMMAGLSVSQDNKTVQIVMTLCCLTAVTALAAEVGHTSSEYERMREEQMKSVLLQQQAMFEQKLRDADGVNRKYHDMKNLLLYLRSHGGGQERNKRAGTENVPGIVGFGKACELAASSINERMQQETELRDYFIKKVLEEIPLTYLNGAEGKDRLPGNVNIGFKFIEAESALILLDQHGIAASSGSACTAGSIDPSHVLLAIGRNETQARESLRFTLSDTTTKEELDKTVEVLKEIIEMLRSTNLFYQDYMEKN